MSRTVKVLPEGVIFQLQDCFEHEELEIVGRQTDLEVFTSSVLPCAASTEWTLLLLAKERTQIRNHE